jgi:uncharacterized membrane protein
MAGGPCETRVERGPAADSAGAKRPAPIGVSKETTWPISEARAWPLPLPEMEERSAHEPLIRWKEDDLMKTRLFLASAIAAAIAVPAVTGAQPAPAPKFEAEKCYGITKAGKNDCQTANSSCAGTSKRDGQRDAWVYVPKGTCERLVNGSMQPRA